MRDATQLPVLLRGQLVLVRETADGIVSAASRIQLAGALDDSYASAADVPEPGVAVTPRATAFKLWAPTAQQVAVCTYASGTSRASAVHDLSFGITTGVWRAALAGDQSGHSYRYVVDVVVDGVGVVRNSSPIPIPSA